MRRKAHGAFGMLLKQYRMSGWYAMLMLNQNCGTQPAIPSDNKEIKRLSLIMRFKCLKKIISLNYYMVSMCLFPLCLHPKGEVQSMINPQAFEAARGSQVYRICCVVGQLKYQSTSVCPSPRIFGKLANCIIRDYVKQLLDKSVNKLEFTRKGGREQLIQQKTEV